MVGYGEDAIRSLSADDYVNNETAGVAPTGGEQPNDEHGALANGRRNGAARRAVSVTVHPAATHTGPYQPGHHAEPRTFYSLLGNDIAGGALPATTGAHQPHGETHGPARLGTGDDTDSRRHRDGWR